MGAPDLGQWCKRETGEVGGEGSKRGRGVRGVQSAGAADPACVCPGQACRDSLGSWRVPGGAGAPRLRVRRPARDSRCWTTGRDTTEGTWSGAGRV